MPEHLPLAGTVDQRGLVRFGRQCCEAAQHDQHHQRRPVPDLYHHQARDHGRLIIDPKLLGNADRRQKIVQDTQLRMKHHGPDEGHRYGCGHHRHDKDGAQHAPPGKALVKDHRREYPENHWQDDREHGEVKRVNDRFQKPLIAQQIQIIVEAGKGLGLGDLPVMDAHPDREKPGKNDHGQDDDQRRHDKTHIAAAPRIGTAAHHSRFGLA